MFAFQIGASFVVDPGQELQPETPAASMLLMGLVGDALVPGHLFVSNAIQEICFGGSWISWKCEGGREG